MSRRTRAVKTWGTLALMASVLVGLRPGMTSAANCTVVPGGLVLFGYVPGFVPFTAPDSNLVIPIDVDEGAGTVTLHREGLPDVGVGTDGGLAVLKLEGTSLPGVIDASGSVSIPNFDLQAIFVGIPLGGDMTLETSMQLATLRSVEYAIAGSRLDFTTGILTLKGVTFVPDAPEVGPVLAGVSLTCRLDPLPDRTKLPSAPVLRAISGKAKGDAVVIRATVSAGRALNSQDRDVIVSLSAGAKHVLLLLARPLTTGRVRAPRPVSIVDGAKDHNASSTPIAGTLSVHGKGRRATVQLRVPGLDLSNVSGALTVTVTIGPSVASLPVTVQGGKIKKAH